MKKLLASILCALMLIPSFAGCASSEIIEPLTADNDVEFVQLNTTEPEQEITVIPSQKAYVRNGKEWADMNWRDINARLGINQNNEEPLVFKTSGTS